ncbi:MAG: hypothetical protein LBC39_02425 [Methanobrevibacter sp.]|jgi:hypothetical protein|nr:hypothetical protein [Candidatus Methanovirga aequatorialis]
MDDNLKNYFIKKIGLCFIIFLTVTGIILVASYEANDIVIKMKEPIQLNLNSSNISSDLSNVMKNTTHNIEIDDVNIRIDGLDELSSIIKDLKDSVNQLK